MSEETPSAARGFAQAARLMKRPRGTIMLGALRPATGETQARLQVVAGAHVFLVRKDAEGYTAMHGCPGVGTRIVKIAEVDAPPGNPDVWLAWSPEALHLYLADKTKPGQIVSREGTPADVRLWVDAHGGVVEVAGGIEGVSVWSGGQEVVGPPALDLWGLTLEAVSVLMGGESVAGYMFEVVAANAALSMLVTGLESYLQARFIELEGEGLPLDGESILRKLGTREEKEELSAGARPDVLGDSDSAAIVRGLAERFSFQNFDRSKALFGRGYGLHFSRDLGLSNQALQRVRTLLGYRHRVAHVSPLVTMHNQANVPPDEPEFSGRGFTERARAELDEFVRALHAASLRLEPPHSGS